MAEGAESMGLGAGVVTVVQHVNQYWSISCALNLY